MTNRVQRGLAALAADEKAVAGVEFGLVLPFLALLWMGMIELNSLLDARSRLQSSTMTFADLVSQEEGMNEPKLTSSQMNTLYTAMSAVMNPLPNDRSVLAVRIASVVIRAGASVPVEAWTWSCGTNTIDAANLAKMGLTPSSSASVITNNALRLSNDKLNALKELAETDASIIVAQVVYAHQQPIFGFVTQQTTTMFEEFMVRPRFTRRLQLDSSTSADITELNKVSYARTSRTCP